MLLRRLGRRDEADRQYALAEAAGAATRRSRRTSRAFSRIAARKIEEAVAIAEAAAADRHDIFTDDALAWATSRRDAWRTRRTAIARRFAPGHRDATIRATPRPFTAPYGAGLEK